MLDRNGNIIISCSMTSDVQRYGMCATCMHYRHWCNCSVLHEGDPAFCDDRDAVTIGQDS